MVAVDTVVVWIHQAVWDPNGDTVRMMMMIVPYHKDRALGLGSRRDPAS